MNKIFESITFSFDDSNGVSYNETFNLHESTNTLIRHSKELRTRNEESSDGIKVMVLKGGQDFSSSKALSFSFLTPVKLRFYWSRLKFFKPFWHFFTIKNSLRYLRPFPVSIRNIRKLQKELSNIIHVSPDIIVIGSELRDWVTDKQYSQPVTAVDEFSNRLANMTDALWEIYGISVVFLFPAEVPIDTDVMVWKKYLASLEDIERQFKSFRLVKVAKNNNSIDWQLIDNEIRSFVTDTLNIRSDSSPHYRYLQNILPRLPTASTVCFDDGESFSTTSSVMVAALWLSSNYAAVRDEEGGIDEGLIVVDKKMDFIGGRNFWERWLQLRILLRLAGLKQAQRASVAIIGDSIRMRISDATGYGLAAYSCLEGEFNILHNPHNCGNTKVSLLSLENWLSFDPDLIFINHGLHDCAVKPNTFEPFVSYISPNEYRDNLYWIAETVRRQGKDMLWGYCTPVVEELHAVVPGRGTPRKLIRRNADIEIYNAIAKSVMDEFGFDIVDIYTPFFERGVERLVLSDGVHLNDEGAVFAGSIVAAAIRNKLKGTS